MKPIRYTSRTPDWSLIPDSMIGPLRRYIENGIPPGDFMTAVLSNDLREACARADDINRPRLFEYVKFLHAYAPYSCWGSLKSVKAWVSEGGLGWPIAKETTR
jgi:hypothetical protein